MCVFKDRTWKVYVLIHVITCIVGYCRLKNLNSSYGTHGLVGTIHGNSRRLPKNALTLEDNVNTLVSCEINTLNFYLYYYFKHTFLINNYHFLWTHLTLLSQHRLFSKTTQKWMAFCFQVMFRDTAGLTSNCYLLLYLNEVHGRCTTRKCWKHLREPWLTAYFARYGSSCCLSGYNEATFWSLLGVSKK